MNKTNKILIGVLAAQAVLAFITWTAVKDTPAVTQKKSLFDFKASDVTKIEIVATQGDEIKPGIKLEKNGENWTLASSDGYPVKADAVTELLDKLIAIEIETPIATTEANHGTLNVAKEGFDRKVTLTAGGKSVTVFFGRGSKSNGHVRLADSNDVYEAAGFSVWSVNSRASNYVETDFIKTEEDKVKKITIANAKDSFEVIKNGDKWNIPGALSATPVAADTEAASAPAAATEADTAEKVLDEDAVGRFAKKFIDIKLVDPVGKKEEDSFGLKNGAKVVVETEKDGKPHKIELVVGDKDDDGKRYVKSSESEYIVKVANWDVEPAVEKTKADFLKDAPSAQEAKEEAAPEMPQGMGMPEGMPPGMMGAPQ